MHYCLVIPCFMKCFPFIKSTVQQITQGVHKILWLRTHHCIRWPYVEFLSLLVYLLCKTSVCSITLIFHPPYWMWTILYRSRACLHPRPSPLAIFNVQVELFLGAKQRILYSFTLYSFVRLSEPTYHPEGLWFSFIPSSLCEYIKVVFFSWMLNLVWIEFLLSQET